MQPRSSGRTCSRGGRTHDRSAGNLAARGDAPARRASTARRAARAGGAGRDPARGGCPCARRTRCAAGKRAGRVAAMVVPLEAGGGCRGNRRGSAAGGRTGRSRRTRAAGRDPGGETLWDVCGHAESGAGRLATRCLAAGCVPAGFIGTACKETACTGSGRQSGEYEFRKQACLARSSQRRARALRLARCCWTRCCRCRGSGEGSCDRTGRSRAVACPDGSCTSAARSCGVIRCSDSARTRVRSARERGRGTRVVAAELAAPNRRAAPNGTRPAGRCRAREVPCRLSRRASAGGCAEKVNRVRQDEATVRLPRPRWRSPPRRSRPERRDRGRSRCA